MYSNIFVYFNKQMLKTYVIIYLKTLGRIEIKQKEPLFFAVFDLRRWVDSWYFNRDRSDSYFCLFKGEGLSSV